MEFLRCVFPQSLLDTCALLWLTSYLEALSPKAIHAIKKNPGGLCVSAISAFEIAIKVKKGHIKSVRVIW